MSTVVALLGLAAMTWVLYRLVHKVAWLDNHEERHCEQLGEMQDVMAQLITHYSGVTSDPLPDDVSDFARRQLDD